MSGDALTPKTSGVQINGIELVRPANRPPTQSTFIDYDKLEDDPAVRGHVGGVATLRKCGADSVFPAGGRRLRGHASGRGRRRGDASGRDGGAGGGGWRVPARRGWSGRRGRQKAAGGGRRRRRNQQFPEVEDGGGGTMIREAEAARPPRSMASSITKSAVPGKCTEQGGCAFNIDITNNSGKPLPEIVVGDELTAGAANLGGAKIEGAPPAPWTCTAPPKLTCKHAGPVANGEAVSLPLSFMPAGIGQETELKNCATAQSGGALGGAAAAAAVPAPKVAEKDGIKFEKTPVSASCSADGRCEWELKVTNTSAEEKKGALVISDGPGIGHEGAAADPRKILEVKVLHDRRHHVPTSAGGAQHSMRE